MYEIQYRLSCGLIFFYHFIGAGISNNNETCFLRVVTFPSVVVVALIWQLVFSPRPVQPYFSASKWLALHCKSSVTNKNHFIQIIPNSVINLKLGNLHSI